MLFISFWLVNNSFALSDSKKENLVKVLETKLYPKIENKSISTQEKTLNKLITQINKILPKASWEKKELLEFLKEELDSKKEEITTQEVKEASIQSEYKYVFLYDFTDAFPEISISRQKWYLIYLDKEVEKSSIWNITNSYHIDPEDIKFSINRRFMYILYWNSYNVIKTVHSWNWDVITYTNKEIEWKESVLIYDIKTWKRYISREDYIHDLWENFNFIDKTFWTKLYLNWELEFHWAFKDLNFDSDWNYIFSFANKIYFNKKSIDLEWDVKKIDISKNWKDYIYSSYIFDDSNYCLYLNEKKLDCYWTEIENLKISDDGKHYSYNTKWGISNKDSGILLMDQLFWTWDNSVKVEKEKIVRILDWKEVDSLEKQDLSKYNSDKKEINLLLKNVEVDDIKMIIKDWNLKIYQNWELLLDKTSDWVRFLWTENQVYDKNYSKPEKTDIEDNLNFSWKLIKSVSVSNDKDTFIINTENWIYFIKSSWEEFITLYRFNNGRIFQYLLNQGEYNIFEWKRDEKDYILNLNWYSTIYFNK